MAKKTTCTNSNLHKAKNVKNDEFYTCLSDIENELYHYRHHFANKVVLCNCDESEHTNFYKYFELNFSVLKLKKLICVGYRTNRQGDVHILEQRGEDMIYEANMPLKGHGDFRDQESIDFLKEADIVVTNPPFSLFREFVAQLIEYNKKFLIIGNKNAIGYGEIFPLLKANKMWLGCTVPTIFTRPDGSIDKLGTLTRWFTNLDTPKRHEELFTGMTYKRGLANGLYPQYDNYDAINIDRVKEIPTDYEGVMGVPITYLDKHNPDQYEIIGCCNRNIHPDFPDTRTYNDFKEMRPDGTFTGASGKKINETPVIQYRGGKGNYHIHPVTGERVQSLYSRLLIKKVTK